MIADALGPVFLLILLGVLLRRINFPGSAIWPGIEQLTYYLAFPALLVHRLALADFNDAAFATLGLVIGSVLVLASALIWVLRPWLAAAGPDFSSIFQGGIRFNTYIGLAVASALHGDAGLVIAAVAASVMIPLVNVLCVLTLALAHEEGRPDGRRILFGIARNPLILACLLGLALNFSGLGLPGWSEAVLGRLGGAALPLGLLAVGVGLSLGSVRSGGGAIVSASLVKFLVLPALMLGLGRALGLDPLTQQVLVLLGCLPTASSAYILARQMGGNAPLMASIISVQSLLAFALMPPWLALAARLAS